jgi:hypothetical protein
MRDSRVAKYVGEPGQFFLGHVVFSSKEKEQYYPIEEGGGGDK